MDMVVCEALKYPMMIQLDSCRCHMIIIIIVLMIMMMMMIVVNMVRMLMILVVCEGLKYPMMSSLIPKKQPITNTP